MQGSAWFFGAHLLFFHAGGGGLCRPGSEFGSPGQHFGSGTFLVKKKMVPEKVVLWRNDFVVGL